MRKQFDSNFFFTIFPKFQSNSSASKFGLVHGLEELALSLSLSLCIEVTINRSSLFETVNEIFYGLPKYTYVDLKCKSEQPEA